MIHPGWSSFVVLAAGGGEGGLMSPNAQMVIWTWVTFGLVSLLLYKTAWKPILAALEAREERVRQSIDDAEKAREELERIAETRDRMLAEAEAETKRLIAEARAGAQEAATVIERKATEKAKILYENAERDIEALRDRTAAELRNAEVDMVVRLAGRLVTENMDTDRNRELADRLIAEMKA